MARTPTRFDLLVARGFIAEHDLDLVLADARGHRADPVTLLAKRYRIPKDEIANALSSSHQCPFVAFDPRLRPPAEMLRKVKEPFLRSHLWVPISKEGGALRVLSEDPSDLARRDAAQAILGTTDIEWCVGFRDDVVRYIDLFFHASAVDTHLDSVFLRVERGATPQTGDEQAVSELVHQIIRDAWNRGASSIHFEPYPGQKPMEVRLRIDGACALYDTIPDPLERPVIARLKSLADLDVELRLAPQEGKAQWLRSGGDKDLDLRINTIPTQGGQEDVVVHLLARARPLTLDGLGFAPRDFAHITRLLQLRSGLLLVTGSAGSGITTTLHSLIARLNVPEAKIWTAEETLDATQLGLRQIQVTAHGGFGYAAALRTMMRADPDAILVGDLPDRDTAQLAVEAALGGQLILAAMRAPSTVDALARLLAHAIDPYDLSSAVIGVLAQRLVRTLCSRCKEPGTATPREISELEKDYGDDDFGALRLAFGDSITIYRRRGCESCHGIGYRGRLGLFELLVASEELRRLLLSRPSSEALRALAHHEGTTTLKQHGVTKVLEGHTDLAELRAACAR